MAQMVKEDEEYQKMMAEALKEIAREADRELDRKLDRKLDLELEEEYRAKSNKERDWEMYVAHCATMDFEYVDDDGNVIEKDG